MEPVLLPSCLNASVQGLSSSSPLRTGRAGKALRVQPGHLLPWAELHDGHLSPGAGLRITNCPLINTTCKSSLCLLRQEDVEDRTVAEMMQCPVEKAS